MENDYFITPPGLNTSLRTQLNAKLAEYRNRLIGKGREWEFTHLDFAPKMYGSYRDALYKVTVLEAVLSSEEPISTRKLSLELLAQHGNDFNAAQFANACGVIAFYCGDKTDEQPRWGTGLQMPESLSA